MAPTPALTAPPAPLPEAAADRAPERPASGAPNSGIDHLLSLYVQTPATLTGNLFGMLIIAYVFWGLAEPLRLLGWLGVVTALWLVRLAHYLRFRRQRSTENHVLRLWRRSWVVLVLCQGAMWGLAVWLFWGLGTPYHRLALLMVVYTYCLASVQLLASQSRVFLVFLCLVLTPTIVRVASDTSQPMHLQMAVILTLMFCITVLMARTYSSALGQAIARKSRTDELASRLRLEMAVADEGRRAAEAASRAKTQFFAAASHDLRQPLHAMGLFAEALRQRSHDPEVASLVNSINESVDALEGLFGELLDITRIDTGGVDVSPAPVRLRELFARLRLHFEPTAFEKGLMLSFRGEHLVAQADPVLLERVLRNLVSNAIRYTDDGGVLVSCRQRQGPDGSRLLLQVWDSGIGIAESSLPRIWDEFYQAQTNRPLEAHHRKGLGLGLAIVKRLAGLMQAPITVRSRVGHGTVFSLELPMGKAQRHVAATDAAAGGKGPLGLTLEDRLILVIEDETAVREGLVVLLQAWGARVASFDTVRSLQDWLDGPAAETPDLLLVDYRLPEGRTGIDALVAARQRWSGRHLPAIMITGSSLGGHEDEALVHDYHLLIKPVLPNKLRAMIAFKLGVRGAAR
ncbi:MAG TPA: hybrid sensor histidine kinase/response regulator [Rubrivivax sp.]|nr:hybrid sensor histidine kinase/response regulator [Rubrivivax sp.]